MEGILSLSAKESMPFDACMELGPIASGTAIEVFIGRGLRLSPVAACAALPRSSPACTGGDSSIDSHGGDHRRIPVVVVHRAGLLSAFYDWRPASFDPSRPRMSPVSAKG